MNNNHIENKNNFMDTRDDSVATTIPMARDDDIVAVRDGPGGKFVMMTRAQVIELGGTVMPTTSKGAKHKFIGQGLGLGKAVKHIAEKQVEITCPDTGTARFVSLAEAQALGAFKYIPRPHQVDYAVLPGDEFEEEPDDAVDLNDPALVAFDQQDLLRPPSPAGSLKDFVGTHPDDQGLLNDDGDGASSVAELADGSLSSLGGLTAEMTGLFGHDPNAQGDDPNAQGGAPNAQGGAPLVVLVRKRDAISVRFAGSGDVPAPTLLDACFTHLLSLMTKDGHESSAAQLNILIRTYAVPLQLDRRVTFVDDLQALRAPPERTTMPSKKNKLESKKRKAAQAFVDQSNLDFANGRSRLADVAGFLVNFCEPNMVYYAEWNDSASSDDLQIDHKAELKSCPDNASTDVLKAKLKMLVRRLRLSQSECMKFAFHVGRMCHLLRKKQDLKWDDVVKELGISRTTLASYEELHSFLTAYPRFFRVRGLAFTALLKYKPTLLKYFKEAPNARELRELWSNIKGEVDDECVP